MARLRGGERVGVVSSCLLKIQQMNSNKKPKTKKTVETFLVDYTTIISELGWQPKGNQCDIDYSLTGGEKTEISG